MEREREQLFEEGRRGGASSVGRAELGETVHPWRQKDSWTVHLVNLTNPNVYGGAFDEVVPTGEQTVRLRTGVEGCRARLLRRGDEIDVEHHADGSAVVKVSSVEDFEIVAIERADR